MRFDEYCKQFYYNFNIDNLESIFNIEFKCENSGILFDSTMSFDQKHNFSYITMHKLNVEFDSLINTFKQFK